MSVAVILLKVWYDLIVIVQVQSWVRRKLLRAEDGLEEALRVRGSRNPGRLGHAPEDKFDWDDLLQRYLYPIGGFGVKGFQIYVKRILALTAGHCEIAYASAINLMRHDSIGTHLLLNL